MRKPFTVKLNDFERDKLMRISEALQLNPSEAIRELIRRSKVVK